MAVDPNPSLEPGQLFEGKYKILRELGRGGFGMVYLGFQESMDRQVALKVLKPSAVAAAPSARERFHREVKIISKLKHPNTVTIHDFGETHDGGLYMVLELVEGEELKQVLKREGAQTSTRAAKIALQIVRSLAEAHRVGVVHRDLKPANVMLTQFDTEKDFVKVLDFGVARLLDPKSGDLTSVGLPEGERELIGTPRYMSPEQVRGEMLTGASDIYGLGLILYEMLSGEPAVRGETTMALITQQISPEPLNLPAMRGLHPRLQDIIRIATSKRVSERFQTAEQMAEALEELIHQLRAEGNPSGNHDEYPNQWGSPSQQNWAPPSQQNWMQHGSGHYPQAPQSGNYQQPNQFQTPSGHYPNQQQPQQQHPFNNPYSTPSGNYQPPIQTPAPALQASPIFDPGDYQPTVERDALDPNQLLERPQGTFDRNQFPSSEMPHATMPPLPDDDDDPFAIPVSEKKTTAIEQVQAIEVGENKRPETGEKPRPRRPPQRQMGGHSIMRTVGAAIFCIIGIYIGFVVMGGMMGTVIDGTGMRLLVTIIAVPVIPIVIALAESMKTSDRVRIVESTITRVTKGMFSAGVFALGFALVFGIGFAKRTIPQLKIDPNWFLTNPSTTEGVGKLNQQGTEWVSSAIEGVAVPIGLYDPIMRDKKAGSLRIPQGTRDPSLYEGRRKALTPPPTRPGNEQKEPKKENSGGSDKKDPDEYQKW